MASSLPESTRPEAVALVLWQGDGLLQVTVRVGRDRAQWVARALTFSERDSISERWTTVGLTVATLVGETRALDIKAGDGKPETSPQPSDGRANSASSQAPSVAQPAPPAAPTPRPAARPKTPPVPRWQGRLGVLTGPGWSGGNWQVGGWLSLGFHIPQTPVVLHAAGSYALSDGPSIAGAALSTRWATAGIGAGVTGTLRALDIAGSAQLEVLFRRIEVDVRSQGASDQDVPVRARGLVSFPASGVLAATGGVVVRLPPGNTNENKGLRLHDPAFSAEVLAGVEVRL